MKNKRLFNKLAGYSSAIGAAGIVVSLTFQEIPNQVAYGFIIFLPLATILAIKARRL